MSSSIVNRNLPSLPHLPTLLTRKTKQRFRIGYCSQILVAAALFWVSMQLALVPNDQGHSSALLRTTGRNIHASSPYSLSHAKFLYIHIGKTGGEWIKSQLAVICKTRKNPQVKQACLDSFQGEIQTHPNQQQRHHQQPQQQTQISRHTIGYLHVHSLYPRNAHALATHYLFSVRHPLTRLISWYVYNHPKSCDPREANSPSCKQNAWKDAFFTTCFPTITDLGMSPALLLDPSRTITSTNTSTNSKSTNTSIGGQDDKSEINSQIDCAQILWNGWYGKEPINVKEPNHLYWNYEFYWNQTLASSPHKPILVIRQEQLLEDMNGLEQQLLLQQGSEDGNFNRGGDFVSTVASKRPNSMAHVDPISTPIWRPPDSTHFVTGRVASSGTTERAMMTVRHNLCCALRRELILYQDLVQRAINLSAEAKSETIQKSYQVCGVQQSWHELECHP